MTLVRAYRAEQTTTGDGCLDASARMVDIVRYFAAALTVMFAVRARLFAAATLAAVALYVYAAEVASVVAVGRGVVGGIEAGFGAIFVGPSVWPARGDGVLPGSGTIGAHATAAHAASAALALLIVCTEAIGLVVLALFGGLRRSRCTIRPRASRGRYGRAFGR